MAHLKMYVAVHLLLIREEKVLLLRRYNTGYEDGNYSVVAGHVDGNETIIAAMKREAKEEAGIDIDEKDLEIVQVMHRRKESEERIDYFLTAKKWQGKIINMEPNKCDDLSWYSVNELPDNIIDYIKASIENYNNDIKFSSYGWE